MNALAAAAASMACGVSPDDVAKGLATATSSPWRMELHRTARGAVVLNDAYNANPTSMEAALRALAALPASRRIAVVGVMAELGRDSEPEHERIATVARELGVTLIAVGTDAYGVESMDVDQVEAVLGPLAQGDAVLVKASRVAGLEVLADQLSGG
jgi:UDP-N-acetylmuramoyl-tripeptide--D-alanyl-D-alanine ligase